MSALYTTQTTMREIYPDEEMDPSLNDEPWLKSFEVPDSIYDNTNVLAGLLDASSKDPESLENIVDSLGFEPHFKYTVATIGDTSVGQDLIWLAISKKITEDKNRDINVGIIFREDFNGENKYEHAVNQVIDQLHPIAVQEVKAKLGLEEEFFCDLGIDNYVRKQEDFLRLIDDVFEGLALHKSQRLAAGHDSYVIADQYIGNQSTQSFIRGNSLTYLPRSQFRGEVPFEDSKSFKELIGQIYEVGEDSFSDGMTLTTPRVTKTKEGTSYSCGGAFYRPPTEANMASDNLILWHTHPVLGGPSEEDNESLIQLHEKPEYQNTQVRSLIYFPAVDVVFSFKVKEL